MSRSRKRSPRRSRRFEAVPKPRGNFQPRVQEVGPEHFGIVSIDPHKARSRWMLADFYGKILLSPAPLEHNRAGFDAAVEQLRQARSTHQLGDVLVAVERTGRYHRPVQRAFANAGFETRIVHPFATKQFRQAADPGNKTDDTDLAAVHRAAVNGFALVESERDEFWITFQLLTRQRRDLVEKTSALCCQVREHLDAAFPGFAACFPKLWDSACAWHVLHHFESPAAIHDAGLDGLSHSLRDADVRFQKRTVERLLAWAGQAAAPDAAADYRRRFAFDLDDDRTRKNQQIQALERDIAGRLVHTPYVLLLSFPGINVVSAADYAAEMGPIEDYANSRTITGRAGLRPSRHQSDLTDRADGPLVRCANRKLRAAILGIADNLIKCNRHFNVLAHAWSVAGKDPRHTRVKVGSRLCRISYQMVAGRQVFRHPCLQGRHYILDKLLAFHREHGTDMPMTLRHLEAAIGQVPEAEHGAEAKPLHEEYENIQNRTRRGPQPLGDILPIVLARLGVHLLESKPSGDTDPQ